MNKITFLVLIIAALLILMATPAFALDGNNWADQMGNGLTGKGGNAYFSGRVNVKFELPICEVKVGGFSFIEMGEPRGESRNYYVGPEIEVTF